MKDLQKTAAGAFAALTIATSSLTAPLPADAATSHFLDFAPTTTVAEKVTREGVYGEYTVDVTEQQYDDARSTYKSAKETKSKKGTSCTHMHVSVSLGCWLHTSAAEVTTMFRM